MSAIGSATKKSRCRDKDGNSDSSHTKAVSAKYDWRAELKDKSGISRREFRRFLSADDAVRVTRSPVIKKLPGSAGSRSASPSFPPDEGSVEPPVSSRTTCQVSNHQLTL